MSDLTHEAIILRNIKDSLTINGETAAIIRPYYEKLMMLPDPKYHEALYIINEFSTRCKKMGAVGALELYGKLSEYLARSKI